MRPRYFLLALLLVASLRISVEASTLVGRVIEVNEGDAITVFNLNRPVRIKLLAIDAPEQGQAFSESARQHLADLIYDKSVMVEYWGISANGSLVGRVMLNNVDVGAQMIRDGAAWFDSGNNTHLSVADREVYQQSEQAARNERRGLWQADDPIAPWEFVRAQSLRKSPAANLNSVVPAAAPRRERPKSELTNLTLMASQPQPSASSVSVDDSSDMAWAAESGPKHWQPFKPAGENFSALVPDDGKKKTIQVPLGDQSMDVNVYASRDGAGIYALMWMRGPSFGERDSIAVRSTVWGFLKGVAAGYRQTNNTEFSCELQGERRFAAGAFRATEYDLPNCTVPAKVRVYTRVVDGERQLYVAAAFYGPDEEKNLSRFMNSFKVSAPAPKAGTAKH